MSWRYLAYRLHGDGTKTFLAEVPLRQAQITDVISGPGGITGTVDAWFLAEKADDGYPILHEWSTAIFAEADDEIRGGAIVANLGNVESTEISLDAVGFTGYATQPYTGDPYYRVQIETLDVVRDIWSWLQAQPGGNIGLQVADLDTGVLIGTEIELVEFTTGLGEVVSFEAGPVKIVPWITDNLAGKIDQLANDCPFDYRERHAYDDTGQIVHHLDFGYPRIGARRSDLLFELDVNVAVPPALSTNGEEYANHVQVVGAGEGQDAYRAMLGSLEPGRLRRVAQVEDKALRSVGEVRDRAERELAWRRGLLDISEVQVVEHEYAPVGSWAAGDEVPVRASYDGYELDAWFRVIRSTITPEQPDIASLTLMRSDKVVPS